MLLAKVRLIHAEQMSLYNFINLRKNKWTQMKTKQLKQDILNRYESIGFPKLKSYFPFKPVTGGKLKKLILKV